ncbi:MAG: DUF484 family protein [Pseudomonadota bacterium]
MEKRQDNTNGSATEFDLIAEFLAKHPTIFQQRPDLLDLIQLQDARGTSSLLERQVARLQDQIAHLHALRDELVDIARDNERILIRLDRVLAKLLTYRHMSEFLVDFPRVLRDTFAIDEVSFKTSALVSGKPSEKLAYKEAVRRVGAKSAICDDRLPSQILNLFFAVQPASAALVPVLDASQSEIIGVLALGSGDPQRFAPELGSAHLDRVGVLTGICVERLSLDERGGQ